MPRELTPQEEVNRDFNQSQSEVGGVLKTLKGTPIKRYKNLVGKEVGGQLYLHKLYVDIILQSGGYRDISENDYNTAKDSIGGFNFNCVMLDSKRRVIRFDEAPDFDTSREPIPGKTVSVFLDGATLSTGYSDQIWHHKWMWVMNDYTGFDVRESWEWSKTYLSVLRDTGDPQANRGIANGMGQGGKLWRAQLRYFGLEEATSMANTIVSSVAFIRDYVAEDVREKEIDQFDADFLNEIIDNCEAIYNDYNEEKISDQELEQRAKAHAQEIIFQYNKESGKTKSYLQDILENFDQDLLSVDIDLGTDISAMTITEAEESMSNKAYKVSLSGESKTGYNGPYGYAYIQHDTLGEFFVSVGSLSSGYKSLKLHPYTNYPWADLNRLSPDQIKFVEDHAEEILRTLFPKVFKMRIPDKLVYDEEDEKKDAKWMWDDKWNLKEAEEPMEGRAFDQALELMDKFDDVLYDYDEGVKDKETVAYKFNSLKYKVEQLKKDCGVEDCTFLNEKMKQFEEILQYYNISLEECNESEEITEARDSVTVNGKTYPVKDKSYLNGKLAGYGNDTGLESIMTVKYKNGDRYTIYDSGIGNMGSSYACAVKIEECNEGSVPYGTGLPDDSYKRSATQDPETSHPYVGKRVKSTETGKVYTVTRAYDDSRGTHVRSDFGGTTITLKDGEYSILPSKKRESKKIKEAKLDPGTTIRVGDVIKVTNTQNGEPVDITIKDIYVTNGLRYDFDTWLIVDFKFLESGKEDATNQRMTLKNFAMYFNGEYGELRETKSVDEGLADKTRSELSSKKITESSQSPMIFKAGNVYKLTPTESYPYDRVEILGIAWNDMVGQCTIQYKVVMKDGSVEEGQSEAGDLINTIKKNNEDRVEFYRTEVPKMNESETLTEAADIAFMIVDAIEGTIKECIDSGEGHYSRDDLSVTAAWADDEDSIDIVIRSEGRSIHYIEPSVASRMGW